MKWRAILKAEKIRVKKKLLIYILALVYIFWATYMYISDFTSVNTMIAEGAATFEKYQQAFAWNNLLGLSGNFALTGWGAGFYIFLGAFWIGDDIDSKMLWEIAISRKKFNQIYVYKILSMSIFIFILYLVLVAWLSFLSVVVYQLSGSNINSLVVLGCFLTNMAVMIVFAMFGMFLTLLLNSAAFGSFLGFVVYVICNLSTMGTGLIKYSLNMATFSIQYHLFSGTNAQRDLVIGSIHKDIIPSAGTAAALYMAYTCLFLVFGNLLYKKRAKN